MKVNPVLNCSSPKCATPAKSSTSMNNSQPLRRFDVTSFKSSPQIMVTEASAGSIQQAIYALKNKGIFGEELMKKISEMFFVAN